MITAAERLVEYIGPIEGLQGERALMKSDGTVQFNRHDLTRAGVLPDVDQHIDIGVLLAYNWHEFPEGSFALL